MFNADDFMRAIGTGLRRDIVMSIRTIVLPHMPAARFEYGAPARAIFGRDAELKRRHFRDFDTIR